MKYTSLVLLVALAPTGSAAVTGETALPTGYMRNLLHLGSLQAYLITGTQPGGPNIALDDFLYAGYGPEYLQQPAQGQSVNLGVTSSETPMIWTSTIATRTDGIWDDGYGGDNYRQYYAITLVVPSTRTVRIAYWIDDRVRAWMDGNSTPVLAVDANATGSSAPFTLASGIHRFVFKYEQVTSSSVFALKFTDAAGADQTDLSYTLSDVIAPAVLTTSPADGATGVAATTSVDIAFSEPMDTTVTPATVGSISAGASGTWTWTDRFHLSWTGSSALVTGTPYSVSISAAAVDRNGNALAPMTFLFTTQGTPPTVSSSSSSTGSGTGSTTATATTTTTTTGGTSTSSSGGTGTGTGTTTATTTTTTTGSTSSPPSSGGSGCGLGGGAAAVLLALMLVRRERR